jgi:hypothetical protein
MIDPIPLSVIKLSIMDTPWQQKGPVQAFCCDKDSAATKDKDNPAPRGIDHDYQTAS